MELKMLSKFLFVIAGLLWSIELIPQLYKTWKSKKISDLSLFFLIICISAFICFLWGAILLKNWVLVFSHFIPFINLIILTILVIKYRRQK